VDLHDVKVSLQFLLQKVETGSATRQEIYEELKLAVSQIVAIEKGVKARRST